MAKHWDEWGEVAVVKDGGTQGPGFLIRWNDGTLSIELDLRMIEVLEQGALAESKIPMKLEEGPIPEAPDPDASAPDGFRRHPNGGGLVSDRAYVAPLTYIGPFVRLCGNLQIHGVARLSGEARIYSSEIDLPIDSAGPDIDEPGKAICPKCGGTHLQIWEDAIISRRVNEVNEAGMLEVDSAYESDGHGDNARFFCVPCGHDFPIPDDIEIE